MAAADRSAPAAESAGAGRVVLYDGVCGFCDATVRWLLAHDRRRVLRYAPLQGETATALRARHAEIPEGLVGLVYVDADQRVHLGSRGIFRILAELDPPWRWLVALERLPRRLIDAVYDVVVRNRYRLFGRRDACRIPDAAARDLFLD